LIAKNRGFLSLYATHGTTLFIQNRKDFQAIREIKGIGGTIPKRIEGYFPYFWAS
jgi:hypothetical protein